MEVFLFFLLPWLASVFLLADNDKADFAWLRRLMNFVSTTIVVFAWCGLTATFTYGVYVWFNGFYGYVFEGTWRVFLGLLIWPMPPILVFYAVRIIRGLRLEEEL